MVPETRDQPSRTRGTGFEWNFPINDEAEIQNKSQLHPASNLPPSKYPNTLASNLSQPPTRASSSVNRIVQIIRIGVSATRLPLVSVSASPLCSGERADETKLFAIVLVLVVLTVRPLVPSRCLIFIRRGPENRRAGNSITHTILRTNGQPAAATIRGTAYRA